MSSNNPQDQPPDYSFQGGSSKDGLLEVARIHRKEAQQLFDRAQEALAEDRPEEARLLTDLAVAQQTRAEEFEQAARDESGDPIVAEILNHQQPLHKHNITYTPTYTAPHEELPPDWLEELKPRPLGPIARAVAWIGSWIA
jgi:acyl-CoA reductase-like NAD-dependent aldehyde dehydrogenase